MSYKKAEHILPQELLRRIQEYVDGESIYIPRKEGKRKPWGEKTHSKESTRNGMRKSAGCTNPASR